jgi:hypothetical protein
MPKVVKKPDDLTDIPEYLRSNPEFRACRRKHAWPDDVKNAERTPWTQAYNDPHCTHEIEDKCRRCGMVRRKRAIAVIIKGKFSFTKLPTTYGNVPEGFAVKGGRIFASNIDEYELEALVRAEQAPKKAPARGRGGRLKVVPPTATARRRTKVPV